MWSHVCMQSPLEAHWPYLLCSLVLRFPSSVSTLEKHLKKCYFLLLLYILSIMIIDTKNSCRPCHVINWIILDNAHCKLHIVSWLCNQQIIHILHFSLWILCFWTQTLILPPACFLSILRTKVTPTQVWPCSLLVTEPNRKTWITIFPPFISDVYWFGSLLYEYPLLTTFAVCL